MQNKGKRMERLVALFLICLLIVGGVAQSFADALSGKVTETTQFTFTYVGVNSSNYHFTLESEDGKTWYGTCMDPNDQGIPYEGMDVSMSKVDDDAMIARIAYEGTLRTDLSVGERRYIISRAAAYHLGRITSYSMTEDVDRLLQDARDRKRIPENFVVYQTAEADYGQQILAWRSVKATTIKIKKTTEQETSYSLADAKYGLYETKEDAKENTGRIETMTTDADGNSNHVTLYFTGSKTYYVKEFHAPAHMDLDKTIYSKTLKEGDSWNVHSIEPLSTGKAKVKKLAGENSFVLRECKEQYSLAGAKYGIYTDQDGAKYHKEEKRVGILTTNENGNSDALELPIGTYWICEIAPSKGFLLDGQPPTKIKVEQGETTVHTSKEIPILDSITILLEKLTSERKENTPSLAGGEFKVEYYTKLVDRQSEVANISPARTWYFETKEDGETGVIHFKENYQVADKGDALYKDDAGNPVGLLGTYVITETRAPKGFVLDETPVFVQVKTTGNHAQPLISYKKVELTNDPKSFRLHLEKEDQETGSAAQGDGSLAGAIFGLYRDDVLIEKFTVNENYSYTSSYYHIGDGSQRYTVKELEPPKGYLPSDSVYTLSMLEEDQLTARYTTVDCIVANQIIKGQIALTKIRNAQAETGSLVPEAGTTFEIYLKSAGSYDMAKHTERDRVVTDEDGFAKTKDLPYGTYTVHQVNGPEGHEMIPDFDVFIDEDGKTYRYTLNNDEIDKPVKIVKKDSETGKIIPVAGVKFKIRKSGESDWIRFQMQYPKPQIIETFETDESGTFQLPKNLPFGSYELVEQEAPNGYVLSSEPVRFIVDGSLDLVEVVQKNIPQKGIIYITKKGEAYSHAKENMDGTYSPVYEEVGLKGVVFEVKAKKDIVTPDGTLRYKKGEVVDRITTDEDGNGKSKPLYLGSYEIREVKAPNHHVISEDVYQANLTYGGQNVEVISLHKNIQNMRQKVKVCVEKHMETDSVYGYDEKCGESVQFAIYAAETLIAEDGTMIPADGLIEIINVKAEGDYFEGVVTCDLPHGSYYVKEYKTAEGYLLDTEKYEVDFSYKNPKDTVVEIKVNGGEPIENRIARGSILGYKVNQNGKCLSGAVIGLFSKEETIFSKETALKMTTSDRKGYFAFQDVPYGKYLIREILPPEGYVVNTTAYPVSIQSAGERVRFELVNEKAPMEISNTKSSPDTGDEKNLLLWIAVATTAGSVMRYCGKRKEL